MHQWAANIIKCKALVANIQELRKLYWIMTLLLLYNRFESKSLTRDRLLPIWVNLSRKEPKTTESSYVPLYTKRVMYFWQISTYYTPKLLFSILWFYLLHEYLLIMQSFIFFSDVLIQTWQIWINFFSLHCWRTYNL